MFKISSITLAAVMMLGASAQAQTQVPADSSNPTPTFRITVGSHVTGQREKGASAPEAPCLLSSIFQEPGLVAGLHGHGARGVRKIVLLAQPAVDAARNFSRRWPFYAPRIPAQQNRQRDLRMRFVGEREEPADLRWRNVIVASAGLPERHFIAAAVETGLPRPVQNRCQQAFPDFRKDQ